LSQKVPTMMFLSLHFAVIFFIVSSIRGLWTCPGMPKDWERS